MPRRAAPCRSMPLHGMPRCGIPSVLAIAALRSAGSGGLIDGLPHPKKGLISLKICCPPQENLSSANTLIKSSFPVSSIHCVAEIVRSLISFRGKRIKNPYQWRALTESFRFLPSQQRFWFVATLYRQRFCRRTKVTFSLKHFLPHQNTTSDPPPSLKEHIFYGRSLTGPRKRLMIQKLTGSFHQSR